MNPGEDGCGRDGVGGCSRGKETISWLLRGSHAISEFAVTGET